jgi:uncharacterized protein (TIGR02145 family)
MIKILDIMVSDINSTQSETIRKIDFKYEGIGRHLFRYSYENGTNMFGFSALNSGKYSYSKHCKNTSKCAAYFSASGANWWLDNLTHKSLEAISMGLSGGDLYLYPDFWENRKSVRCIMDR